eukprot:COSAG03_NODE_17655_length_371_cov_0.665441_1_plen_63_part_00
MYCFNKHYHLIALYDRNAWCAWVARRAVASLGCMKATEGKPGLWEGQRAPAQAMPLPVARRF